MQPKETSHCTTCPYLHSSMLCVATVCIYMYEHCFLDTVMTFSVCSTLVYFLSIYIVMCCVLYASIRWLLRSLVSASQSTAVYVLFRTSVCEAYKTVVHNKVFFPISGVPTIQLWLTLLRKKQMLMLREIMDGLHYMMLPCECNTQYMHSMNSVCIVHLCNLPNWMVNVQPLELW